MATKPTAPAVPDAPVPTPPAAATGAGTSVADADLLAQLTGDSTGDGTGDALPPAAAEPHQAPAAATSDSTDARNPHIGTPGFDVEAASEDELDAHLRILEKKERIRQLTAGDAEPTASGASAPAETLTLPGVATVTVTPTPVAASQPGPKLITKVDALGNEQSLPQAAWDALGAANLAKFTDVPTQPAKPASLI
jgi:hypothetical protein